MAQEFDPYYTWLGIPPSERPADHYRLLGVPRFEENADVISNAADARMAFIRTFQAGPKGVFSQQILNELAAARTTLLNHERKSAYDQQLKATAATQATGTTVLPVAAAIAAPDHQSKLDDLARQLEQVKAREALLAQQQAQYAAALAQAEARRQAEARPPAPAVPLAKAAVEPFPSISTTPVIAVRKPVRKQSISLPLLIAGIAIPIVLLGLVVGYLATRGNNSDPVVEKPRPSPDVLPPPKVPTPDPKPDAKPVIGPGEKIPDKVKPPVENKPPMVPVAGKAKEIDLLSLVATPRDVPLGEVIREKEALSIKRHGGFACAVVPYDLPASYELELRVTPREGEGLLIGVPIGGRRCMLTIDGFLNEPPNKETRTALETIDGRRPHDAGYTGEPYFGKLLKPDVESLLSIRVSSNSLTLTCDGKQVIDWSGDPSRLGIYGLFDQGAPRRMFVGSWAAQYDVSRLTLKPQDAPTSAVATKSAVDLLAKIELPRDLVQGKAALEKGTISIRSPERGGFSCVRIPVKAPPNYQLDLRVTPRAAEEGFILGVSVGGRPCMIGVDGYLMTGPARTSLEAIDGRRPFERGFDGPIHVGRLLKDDVESLLSVRVVGDSVQLTCDGQQILSWRGDSGKLSIHPMFGRFQDRSMFLASWSATYDVASLSLQPLDGPTIVASTGKPKSPNSSPSTPTTDSRPWRWARFNDGAAGLVLTPDRTRAISFHPGRAPWTIQPIDLAAGELADRLEGQGSIENPQALAVGPDSLVAFSVFENNNLSTLVKSLAGERKQERQFAKQPPDKRYAFSADGKYLAASVGPRINVLNVDSGRSIAHIDPPADMRLAFVERLIDDSGLLLVLYSIKKNGGQADNRAVAYEWKSRRVKRSRDFTTRNANLRGLHFESDDLWVWGNDNQRGMVTSYPVAGAAEQHLRLSPSQSVTDIHIPSQTALVIDANVPRLTVRNFAANAKQTQVEYSSPIVDARFVEDGKAILCQPSTPADLTLLWETAPLLDNRRVVAPTIKEVGLEDAQLQAATKAVQRSDVKLSRSVPAPVSPGSTETPERQEAKAELSKLRIPMPGGAVKFLNIQSNEFSEEHARLLLAFPELDGLQLQNIQPTEKMLEYLAQLPGLKNLGIMNSPLTDEHLAGLAKATQLQSLQMHGTQIAGEGLKHLVDLPLRSFGVGPSPPNLAGWQAIGQFKLLESCGNFGDQADEKMAAISDLPNLKHLNLNGVRLTGQGLKPIEKLTTLVNLELPQIDLADDDLRPLRSLTNLQNLSLPNSVGDGAIEHLPDARLTRLRVGAGITDAGLLAIAKKYPDLQTCDLTHCSQATEKGLGHLADHTKLHTLVLPNGTTVAMCKQVARMQELKKLEQPFQALLAAHLAPLRSHPSLEEFQLNKVDDDALAELAQLPALKALHLNEPLCKAKGLEQLAKASKLERLSLMNGSVLREYGAAEAAAFAKLTQLKELNVYGAALDNSSVDKIRQSLPKTRVQIM